MPEKEKPQKLKKRKTRNPPQPISWSRTKHAIQINGQNHFLHRDHRNAGAQRRKPTARKKSEVEKPKAAMFFYRLHA